MRFIRISLFGKLQALCDGQSLVDAEARKVQELFSYLLLYRQLPHSREKLASMLWAECSTSQSKKYLRQTLWQLNAAVDDVVKGQSVPILQSDDDYIRINPHANIWLDVAIFEQTVHMTQDFSGPEVDDDAAQAMREATQLYQNDLLVDWYHDWCIYERERLQRLFLSMLDKLISHCEVRGNYEGGIEYGERVLKYDRAHERTHRRLMRLLYLNNDRSSALRQYERCVIALKDELDVTPSERTQSLYEQIRADRLSMLDHPPNMHLKTVTAPHGQPMVITLLDRLKQLREILDGLQNQLRLDIESVEQSLVE